MTPTEFRDAVRSASEMPLVLAAAVISAPLLLVAAVLFGVFWVAAILWQESYLWLRRHPAVADALVVIGAVVCVWWLVKGMDVP